MSKKILVLAIISLFTVGLIGFSNSVNAEDLTATTPSIAYLSPSQGTQDTDIFNVMIKGVNFAGTDNFSGCGISPVSDNGFQLLSCKVISDTEIEAQFSISSIATIGVRNITIQTPTGGKSNAVAFTVIAPNTSSAQNLTVVPLSFSPLDPKVGDEIAFTSEIKNIGSNKSEPFKVCDYIDDVKTNCNSGYVLYPNRSEVITWSRTPNWPSQFTEGNHTFKIVINDNQIEKQLNFTVSSKKDAGDLLDINLDRVALNNFEILKGFKITNLDYMSSDSMVGNFNAPKSKKYIQQTYRSNNYNSDSYATGLRLYNSVIDAQNVFNINNSQHTREVINLSSSEMFGDELFCHASPDFTKLNSKIGGLLQSVWVN